MNKAVKSAALVKTTTQTGANLELANGRKITVKFNNTQKGGSITIKSSTNSLLANDVLPSTIQALKLYN